jgi:hypothetical protein
VRDRYSGRRGDRGWKGGSEDEAGSMRPDRVHDGSSSRDLATKSALSLGKRSLNHVDPLHDAVALSVPTSVSVGSSEQEIIEHASPISTAKIEVRIS